MFLNSRIPVDEKYIQVITFQDKKVHFTLNIYHTQILFKKQ